MNTFKFVGCWLVVLLVFIVCPAFGEQFQKEAFSITLPDGWVEIPGEILDTYEKEMAKVVQDAADVNYDYGFQLDASGNWLTYPYVLIQVKNTGRMSESQLKEIEGISAQKELDEMKAKVGSFLSDVQSGKTVYDQENNIMWARIDMNAVNVGPVVGVIGMIPTQKGVIQVFAYCPKAEYSTYSSIFRSAVISTTPAPELAYKKMEGDNNGGSLVSKIDWGRVLRKGLLWGLIFAGISGGLSLIKKRKAGRG